MGFLSNLKKIFNKNIECGEELVGHFIYLYPSSNRIVHVNSHIIVPDDYFAVFVCNDRVTDVLPPGKHKISGAVLPKSFAKTRIDKPNKYGNYKKKFKADIYYVFKGVMEQQQFCSFDKFFKKSSHFGRVKGYTEGLLDIQVTDPEQLFKVLLIDRYYIKNKEGIKLVTGYIGNEVNRMLESGDLGFTEIILNPAAFKQALNPAINARIENLGVRVYNLEVSSFKLNRKLQKQVAMFLTERKQVHDQFEQSGIKYTPEQIVPDKVDVSSSNPQQPTAFSNEVEEQPKPQQTFGQQATYNQSFNQIQTPNQNVASANNNPPQIIRRGGFNPQQNLQQKTEYKAQINTNEVFKSENKKVCKFCNSTIDGAAMFCPKCGFKQ